MSKKIFSLTALIAATFIIAAYTNVKKTTLKNASIERLDEFGPAIIELIKTNDSTTFYSMFITEEEFSTLLKTASFEESQRPAILGKMKADSLDKKSARNFRQIQKQVSESKIDWKSFSLVKNDFKIDNEANMESGAFKYEFTCGGKKYTLSSRRVLKTSNGWKLTRNVWLEDKEAMRLQMKAVMIKDSLMTDSVKKAEKKKVKDMHNKGRRGGTFENKK